MQLTVRLTSRTARTMLFSHHLDYLHTALWIILLWSHCQAMKESAFSKIVKVNGQYAQYKDNGRIYQIDMKIPSDYYGKRRLPRAATSEKKRLWPGGVILYKFADSIDRRYAHLKILKGAMKEWEKKTCIRFKERTDEPNYVEFYYGSGCNSDVGVMNTGKQTTSLGKGCEDHGIMVHEIGHLLGLYHEQNRPDRDDYVKILIDNVIPTYRYAFQKKDKADIDSRKVPYDYYSVMHYGATDFTKNKEPTIVSRKEGITQFGNDKVSNLDAKVINLMYGCPELIKFPNDFRWKAYGLSRLNDPKDCIKVDEPEDPYSWNDNYLCRRPGKTNIGLEWSQKGPINGMTCIKAHAPTMRGQYSWNDNFWCWPKGSVYKFTWWTRTPDRSIRHQCIKIFEPRDRLFSRGRYYLCGRKDESPVDGEWSAWSEWSRCTRQCGGGFHRRIRSCNNPAPSYGGKYCQGENFMTGSCGTKSCDEWPKFPDDFVYKYFNLPPTDKICLRTFERFDFYEWSHQLFCTPDDMKDPLFDWSDIGPRPGMNCVRIYNPIEVSLIARTWDDNFLCYPKDTPYKFKFSRKGPINGLACLRWFPKKNRGWDNSYLCAEQRSDSPPAEAEKSISGIWSQWNEWTICTKSCDRGTQTRQRSCTNPTPRGDGQSCPGSGTESRQCNVHGCVTDGKWSDWKPWTACTVSCGGGEQQRRRTCTNPAPRNGGEMCEGADVIRRRCNEIPCAIHGAWSQWSWWGRCSRTCAQGTQLRSRTCSNPTPRDGGRMCFGPNGQTRTCNNGPCPINGNWARWSRWSLCSKPCNGGVQVRTRTCSNPTARYGGRKCLGAGKQERRCNTRPCSIDGAWSQWSYWKTCSKSCGGGVQTRGRICNSPIPRYGGKNCFGKDLEEQGCNTKPCPPPPIHGGWSSWMSWQPCTKTCSGGIQERMRTCSSPKPQHGGRGCQGINRQEKRCNTAACPRPPIHGKWTRWGPWLACSAPCGGGSQQRYRNCNNPKPAYGGRECSGKNSQSRQCNAKPCKVDGKWSNWSYWTECTKSCGEGQQARLRSCSNPAPQFGGRPCTGQSFVSRSCNTNTCKVRVDGNWSQWTSWKDCSSSCGGGFQQRTRTCTNPQPVFGGRSCVGNSFDTRRCNGQPCPIEGQWSSWSYWRACSRSCGGGIRQRKRNCNNPKPEFGGKNCIGPMLETQQCNSKSCGIDGSWSEWSVWLKCTKTCGGGLKRRTRSCTNPKPSFGGAGCLGHKFEVARCNRNPCKIDGRWSEWSSWLACSRRCGGGIQQRLRTCSNPKPQYGGRKCIGYPYESRQCNANPCRIDGKWSPWSSWRACNQECGGGIQRRFRTCTNPRPGNGGKDCLGRRRQKRPCNTQPCKIDGKWSKWSSWGTCSASCNGGFQVRARTCSDPSPSNGGRNCIGLDQEKKQCNTQSCAVEWGEWSDCSTSCGGGIQRRRRKCQGRCVENEVETKTCNTFKCKIDCGGNMTDHNGRITSPRYPYHYPNNVQCTWRISVPDGLIIKLSFKFFYMENEDTCSNDYVEVRDGPSHDSLLLGRFCGVNRPESQVSSQSSLWVRFHANSQYNYNGFEAVWSPTKLDLITEAGTKLNGNDYIPGCGGYIQSNYGRLTSPLYPASPPANSNCEWIIAVSKGRIIQFYFDDLDIADDGYCRSHYVSLRDGGQKTSPSLGRYCGLQKPARRHSKTTSNILRIRLKSTDFTQRRGFSLWWTSYYKYKSSKPVRRSAIQAACPHSWISHRENNSLHCYSLRKHHHTWSEAFVRCRQLGAELASITTDIEQDFITNYVLRGSYAWIGLGDVSRENKWKWADGSVVDYTYWSPGEPNKGDGLNNEHCALMKSNGQWNDYPCDFRFKFVCKVRKDLYLWKT